MTKTQKNEVIELLKEKFSQYNNFYVTNTESLSVAQVNKLRGVCYSKDVEMQVAKNTLIRKALESLDNEKYIKYKHNVIFRPIESLLSAMEDSRMLGDDFDLKYRLAKVLFGS